MTALSLPVSRLPGIVEVAREVLGLDPWALTLHVGACPWWGGPGGDQGIVPLTIPAGRLVAETWLRQSGGWSDWWEVSSGSARVEHCLWLGDLLTLCSALGVEVPKGTVPPFARHFALVGIWRLGDCEDPRFGWAHTFGIDIPSWKDGRHHVVEGLVRITDPREALDAILASVLP